MRTTTYLWAFRISKYGDWATSVPLVLITTGYSYASVARRYRQGHPIPLFGWLKRIAHRTELQRDALTNALGYDGQIGSLLVEDASEVSAQQSGVSGLDLCSAFCGLTCAREAVAATKPAASIRVGT